MRQAERDTTWSVYVSERCQGIIPFIKVDDGVIFNEHRRPVRGFLSFNGQYCLR